MYSLVVELLVELSSRLQYALLALVELANHSSQSEPLRISQITARQPIPDRYLEQILTNLRRDGIVQSHRGAKGGYILAREAWKITLLEIIYSVNGSGGKPQEGERSESPTLEKDVVDEIWQQATESVKAVLGRYTLQDLCQRCNDSRQINPMYYI